MIEILQKNNSDLDIILTVSPVPAFATFIDSSVVLESFAAKCLLRSVVHRITKDCSGVYYFPSFEITLCKNPKTYTADNMHVKKRRVRKIFSILEKSLMT